MNWLQKYFVPAESNEFKPHFLRGEIVFGILAVILVIEGAFLSQAMIFGRGTGFLALIMPNTLIDQTNQNRIAAGISPLTENPLLTAAAQQKANDMAANGYFAHTSPAGVTPWYWFQKVGYKYTHAGENLAVNFSDSRDVENAWMNSPDHRANILNPNYTQIGIATAQGTYQGRATIFVVQLFGKPPVQKPIAAAPSAPKPSVEPVARPTDVVQPAEVTANQFNSVAVAGAETENPAVPNASKPVVQPAEKAAEVQPTLPPDAEPESNLIQRLFAAPRLTTNVVYVALAALILTSLLLNVFMKIQVQHPQLVLNGLMVLLAIGTLAIFNQHLLLAEARIF